MGATFGCKERCCILVGELRRIQLDRRDRILVFTATYNEAGNVERLCRAILALDVEADILVLDDNSPDGTGAIVDRLAAADGRVHVVHRPAKLGLGTAHVEGILWAYEHGYSHLVTMDCDFTHPPEEIPRFVELAPECHVVVGSRFLRRDSLPGWNWLRRTLTKTAHAATRLFLGMPLDATGSFRLYRLDLLPRELFLLVRSRGYSFFFESLFLLWHNGVEARQVALTLPARESGSSKMRVGDGWQSVRMLVGLTVRRVVGDGSLRCGRAIGAVRAGEAVGQPYAGA